MNTQPIKEHDGEYLKIRNETLENIKTLLKDIKYFKNEKLEKQIRELQRELKEVKKAKKYGLVWEEKEEFFDKETLNKLPVLEEIKEKNIKCSPPDKGELEGVSNNILIEGDNYHTLSVLNYTHKNKIDIIYIDPPYNTGNNDFKYNDTFVDKEDKFRHSKWLSFMNKRLLLAKNLLTEKGVIFISIDDNEVAQLKLLCDEIFGNEKFISQSIWRKRAGGGNDSSGINIEHEYVFCYGNLDSIGKIVMNNKIESKYKYKDEKYISHGGYILKNLNDKSLQDSRGLHYDIICPDGFILKGSENQWKCNQNTFNKRVDENRIVFQKNKKNERGCFYKIYLNEEKGKLLTDDYGNPIKRGVNPNSLILDIALNKDGSDELRNIFIEHFFDYPKPKNLIKYILTFSCSKQSNILDFFAGSGTTGHAVLELNKEDGGNRKFILATNNENNICEEVTYERIKRVMSGYINSKGEQVEGLGGNLTYLKTDFIDKTNVNDDLRLRMVNRCSELLCLKENIWNEVIETGLNKRPVSWKFYQRHDKYLAILYDMFYFDKFKEELGKLNKPVAVYVFSHYKLSKRDFDNINIDFEIEQIPDPILEVYESIFGL